MQDNLQVKVLSAEKVGMIYEKSLDILSKKGVRVEHQEALRILDKAGAQVDFDACQVCFPRDIVETALNSVPRSLTLAGRNKRHDIVVPHPEGLFYVRSSTGARTYLDPDTNTYRDMSVADIDHWAQLVEVMDEIDICAFPSPRDVPGETADIHALRALLENTSKPIHIQPYSSENVPYLLELCQVVAGDQAAFKKRPIAYITLRSLPPLVFRALDIEILLQASRSEATIGFSCLPSAGGTSPITIGGTVLQEGVEILAMLVMSQLMKPGTPAIAMTLFFTLDMASGRTLQSSIESILGSAASAQYIKEAYGIPTHVYGFGTDSPSPDGQCMTENTLRGLLVALSGCDILGGAGQLDVATVISPVQLVIDDSLASMLKRLKAGIIIDDETLAWKEILDIVPGSHFLELSHTLRHCHDALRTELFVSQPRETWSAQGSQDLYARALEKYEGLKNKLEPLALPEDVKKELDKIVKEADKRLAR